MAEIFNLCMFLFIRQNKLLCGNECNENYRQRLCCPQRKHTSSSILRRQVACFTGRLQAQAILHSSCAAYNAAALTRASLKGVNVLLEKIGHCLQGDGYTSYKDVPVAQIKKITAQRLLESKQTIPHYYLTIDCKVDKLLALRKQLNDALASGQGGKLSLNDFVIKASALVHLPLPNIQDKS